MAATPFVCARCVRNLRRETLAIPARCATSPRLTRRSIRASSSSAPAHQTSQDSEHNAQNQAQQSPEPTGPAPSSPNPVPEPQEQGALSRLLEQATEDALIESGRSGRKTIIEQSGFSEELKDRLLAKIQDARFRSENASAFASAGLDEGDRIAGQGTRDIAAAQPWTGEEAVEDTVLRMLTDAHKPLKPGLRGRARIPEPDRPMVDMRIKGSGRVAPGVRITNARERASAYAGVGGIKESERDGLSYEEREARRKEFRERFEPAARAVPATISGLAALANERIEDAIARGQFKNIPRGKGIERDTRADNPFIDTTEYIMNKMIKRQDIVPPWIEKQQELIKAATTFRARLRNDWKRHAARMISSAGGTLKEKMQRAEEYARAEEVYNPRKRNVDQISVPTNVTEDPVMVKMRMEARKEVEEAETLAGIHNESHTTAEPSDPSSQAPQPTEGTKPAGESVHVFTRPFRDPDWEATERSYMELAIANLNNITRSYNLMAPELAKKPYFNLERELNNAFADVAPQLAREIRDRANRPAKNTLGGPERPKGLIERYVNEGKGHVRVYENRAPHYGFKEMWRDLFGSKAA